MTRVDGALADKVVYRGERFVAREEDLLTFRDTLSVQHRRTVRPKRRRSWTEEAMREALRWVLDQGDDAKDYMVLGPDGTREMAERIVAEMRA